VARRLEVSRDGAPISSGTSGPFRLPLPFADEAAREGVRIASARVGNLPLQTHPFCCFGVRVARQASLGENGKLWIVRLWMVNVEDGCA